MGVIYSVGSFVGGGGTLPQYGNGLDGNITILSGYTVNIKDLYENDDVPGVITNKGEHKGLNYGVGSYNPKNNQSYNNASNVINALNFTIEENAVLTTNQWQYYDPPSIYVDPTPYVIKDDSDGIIWIACVGSFINRGTIQLNYLGGDGGRFFLPSGRWYATEGLGTGKGGISPWPYDQVPGAGGPIYNDETIDYTDWDNIYGSGGGAGQGYNTNGGAGGSGGGSLRVYAINQIITSEGYIYANGYVGGNGGTVDSVNTGGGGGGTGGAIYLESLGNTILGAQRITCYGGDRGYGGMYDGGGKKGQCGGGGGGFAIVGNTGYRIVLRNNTSWTGGYGAYGRIAIKCPSISGSTYNSISYLETPSYYNILYGTYGS